MKRILNYIFHRDHLIIVLSAYVQLWALGFIAINLDFFNPISEALDNFSISDIFFEIQQSNSTKEENDLITIVDMTELYSRGDIATLLEEINLFNPISVGVDLIFEGEKDDPLGNELLEKTVTNISDKTIFAQKLIDYNSAEKRFEKKVQSFFAEKIGIQEAYANFNDDMSGSRIRDFSLSQNVLGEKVLSFPAKIASSFDSSLEQLDNDVIVVNYRNVIFPVVSYNEIPEKNELINGHIVLVGTMTEEQDMHNTPLGKMPGLEIQAYSLLTLLEHKGIKETPKWIALLISFIVCYLLELTLDICYQQIKKNTQSVFITFLKESNLIDIILLFLWATMICWLMFMVFIYHNVTLSKGTILALMALVCEGRDIYKAIIKALSVKLPENNFVETSLLLEDD
ncbi:MAG: CHASE2 domain-containing protein [Bacteroidaceae bacterium]|nr:CHASE2 domain-containing protein [Bacteroidaceae bacterium]